jgi:hypothetical protein
VSPNTTWPKIDRPRRLSIVGRECVEQTNIKPREPPSAHDDHAALLVVRNVDRRSDFSALSNGTPQHAKPNQARRQSQEMEWWDRSRDQFEPGKREKQNHGGGRGTAGGPNNLQCVMERKKFR